MSDQIKNSQHNIRGRADRLTLALYAVSEYFPALEPLRWEIRKSVLKLVQFSLSYTDPFARDLKLALKDIKDEILRLVTYTEVLEVSALLSDINCRILRDELLSFNKAVENYYEMHRADGLDLTNFSSMDKSDLFEHIEIPKHIASSNSYGYAGGSRDRYDKDASVLKLTPRAVEHETSFKSDRQTKIVEYVQKNGPSSIRDISGVVKGCSEKTIQRELSGMVDSGLLRREGERRWSRYLIA